MTEKQTNDIDKLNRQIRNKYIKNIEIWKSLDDNTLYDKYIEYPSVKKKITNLKKYLKETNITEEQITNIINNKDFCLEFLIPPGTKSAVRGNEFNNIIKNKILSITFLTEDYDIQFEKKCSNLETDEIPDFYILNTKLNKAIIGMNQISLIGGGHQTNRASKYIFNNKSNDDNKTICLIAEYPELIKSKNKTYKIFSKGFENNILLYLSDLESIIKEYFKIE
tara:strand:- start:1 stop:669 length:669 start_codon:yes stop_codon:yes gene_type:complete